MNMNPLEIDFLNNNVKFNRQYLTGLEDPLIPIFLSTLFSKSSKVFYIAKDDKEMFFIEQFVYKSIEDIEIISIPSWDALPYDVSSPNKIILGKRIVSLTKLLNNNF